MDEICINQDCLVPDTDSDISAADDAAGDGLSIIIPAFNEEKGIELVLQRIIGVMAAMDTPYEIIVINDGSSDQTSLIVEKFKEVKLLNHRRNIGYGAALKTGIRYAGYNNICVTDADGTYPVDMIPTLYGNMVENCYEMVVGARIGEICEIPLMRRFPKFIIGKFANYLTGESIPDINSGLRIITKRATERFMNILPDGFSFTTTITLAMITNNMSVNYLPIEYYKRKGYSKIRPIHETLNFFQLIIRTCLYYKPLKIFIPLSFFLALLAFLVLFLSYVYLENAMDVTFGILLMTSVIVIAIGMLADLIDKRL